MRRLAVIGGGISGLAAAWAAARAARGVPGGLQVTVFEREREVGGKARTVVRDGWLAESGPGGFIAGNTALDALIRDCGLDDQRVTASESAARRFLYHDGRMRRVSGNPLSLARSGILSARGMLRLAAEPFVPRGGSEGETVWQFAARRLGAEAADRLVTPMALGVFAGDARRLSLAAAFPRMAALEREHGSLIRGLIARRGRMSAGPLTSFRDGMQSLPRALAARGDFVVRCGAEVCGIARGDGGWRVGVAGDAEAYPADAIVLAGDPWASARLMGALDTDAARDLAAIPSPPVSVVSLGYGGADAIRIPVGFGVLIGRGEGLRALGNLWDSRIFPGRGPEGHVLVRMMFGGAGDPDAGALGESVLLDLARDEVARIYGIRGTPAFTHVVRWPRAIPQYEEGHLGRVARIEAAAQRLGGLFVTGFGLRGVAFANAAAAGLECGQKAALALGSL